MYTPDGYTSAQLQTPGVPAFDPPGSDADGAEVGRRYVAYTGRFLRMGGEKRIPYVRWKRLEGNQETRELEARLRRRLCGRAAY